MINTFTCKRALLHKTKLKIFPFTFCFHSKDIFIFIYQMLILIHRILEKKSVQLQSMEFQLVQPVYHNNNNTNISSMIVY